MTDPISDTPPEGETERAIWTIRRLVKATTGKDMSEEEAQTLFATARARMTSAMAEVTPTPPSAPE